MIIPTRHDTAADGRSSRWKMPKDSCGPVFNLVFLLLLAVCILVLLYLAGEAR